MDTVVLPDSPPIESDLDLDPTAPGAGELTATQKEILTFIAFCRGLGPLSDADQRDIADYVDRLDNHDRAFFSRHARQSG